MYNVIRKGNTTGELDRAKSYGYYDAENDAGIVKGFERRKDAEEYAEACNSMWTPEERKKYNKEYLVVAAK